MEQTLRHNVPKKPLVLHSGDDFIRLVPRRPALQGENFTIAARVFLMQLRPAGVGMIRVRDQRQAGRGRITGRRRSVAVFRFGGGYDHLRMNGAGFAREPKARRQRRTQLKGGYPLPTAGLCCVAQFRRHKCQIRDDGTNRKRLYRVATAPAVMQFAQSYQQATTCRATPLFWRPDCATNRPDATLAMSECFFALRQADSRSSGREAG